MKQLKIDEISLVQGAGDSLRIGFSILLGGYLGYSKYSNDQNSADLTANLATGIIAATVGTQIVSYLSDYNEIYFEKYEERKRISYI